MIETGMTEKEKMLAGEVYYAAAQELLRELQETREKNREGEAPVTLESRPLMAYFESSRSVGGLLYAQMRDLQSLLRFVSNRQMMILYDTNDMGYWNDWMECYLLQKCG